MLFQGKTYTEYRYTNDMADRNEIISKIMKEKNYYNAISLSLKHDIEKMDSIVKSNSLRLKKIYDDRKEIEAIISFLEEITNGKN